MRVLLLSMPFGAVDRPALGLSLLKAGLAQAGHDAKVAYPFEYLIGRIGVKAYQWLTDEVPYTTFAGDWCFTQALYGPDAGRDRGYVQNVLMGEWQMQRADILRLFTIRKQVAAFLNDVMGAFDWAQYDLVGFTSTFVQNIASLAFARELKKAHPHLKITFGGANWEDVMGEALFDSFPFIDFVCRGEADESLPRLATYLDAGRDLVGIPGLLFRGGKGGPQMQIQDMDALPFPDMSDYFAMLNRNNLGIVPTLLMETSRGCWWGAKHHCTFCGLNGQGMAFRSKSPSRAMAEIDMLRRDNDCEFISMVDNILDMKYFHDLIPALAERDDSPGLFYETKANLNRKQIRLLARANVRTIQPGIESLSNRILKLMRKGTSALRNIQLLKWCREMGVGVEWNILYGFPGETDADYDEMLKLMPRLTHLQPPSGSGPVRFDRFSPYQMTPEAFGLGQMEPLSVFSYLYPFGAARLGDIACYFEVRQRYSNASPQTVSRLLCAIDAWKAANGEALQASDNGSRLGIADTRHGQQSRFELVGADRATYILCDQIRTPGKLVQELHELGYGSFSKEDIVAFLDRLVDANLVLKSDGNYLALALYDRFPAGLAVQRPKELLAGE